MPSPSPASRFTATSDCPIDDIKAAFFGRVWVALAYESWAEWCECELDGFRLPAVERREVVAELAGTGMSNRAIADVIGVNAETVNRDQRAAGAANAAPGRKVTGQDGKTYTKPSRPQPKPAAETTTIDGTTIDAPAQQRQTWWILSAIERACDTRASKHSASPANAGAAGTSELSCEFVRTDVRIRSFTFCTQRHALSPAVCHRRRSGATPHAFAAQHRTRVRLDRLRQQTPRYRQQTR